jgi:ketosteroid isomerase-like protein
MKGRASLWLVPRSLALAGFLVLAGNGSGYAQQAEIGRVKAAIETYHAAIGARDFAKMEPLWLHDPGVMVVNPVDKGISVGWDAVKKDWEAGFKNNPTKFDIKQLEGPHIVVRGNVAWSTGLVSAANANAKVFEMDVFEKRAGKWLLVSHAALRMAK